MDILEKIVANKRKVISEMSEYKPIRDLESTIHFSRNCHSLYNAISYSDKHGIIAEHKRKSPSKGIINSNSSLEEIVVGYESAGASALSVLTDLKFFGGMNHHLFLARSNVEIPILRKDFIITEYQIIEAKSIGADAILLIGECLSTDEVKEFSRLAQSLGMEVLYEVYSEDQLSKVTEDIRIVGINNRDLKTFKVDIERSIRISNMLPEGVLKIAESGIHDAETLLRMKMAGFDGFLIGEQFMKTRNPGDACKDFIEMVDKIETTV